MKINELQSIITSGEGLQVEFKTCSEKLPGSLFETICAFLNTKGGIVLLGVEDSGNILGIAKQRINRFKKEIANLSNNQQKLSPAFYLSVEEFEFDGKIVLLIDVPESSQVHKTNDTIFIRNEDGDYRVYHPVEIARIVNRKQNYHTEQRVFPHFTFNDFSINLIEKAKHLIKLNNPENHLWELDNREFLTRLGFYRKNDENQEGFSLAAILFFGSDEVIHYMLPAFKFEALLRKDNPDRYDDRLTVRTNLLDA